MIRLRNIRNLLFSPFFLALIPAIIIIWILPDIFSKYNVKQIKKRYENVKDSKDYYIDLNNDGLKEHVEIYEPSSIKNAMSFLIFNYDGGLIDQYNFEDVKFKKILGLFFGNWDNDDYIEIYGFSTSNDSVFLNWTEPLSEKNPPKHTKFISTIKYNMNGEIDFSCPDLHSIDMNNDNYNEIVFPLTAGHSLQPRVIIAFDIKNHKIYSTITTGSTSYNLKFKDFDGDNRPEIICSSNAPNNIHDSTLVNYLDDRPWLKVYSSYLESIFDPIDFPRGLGAGISCYLDSSNNNLKINLLYSNRNNNNNKSFVASYNVDGKELKKLYLDFGNTQGGVFFHKYYSQYLVFHEPNELFFLTRNLDLARKTNLMIGGINPALIDLDDNGQMEFIITSDDKKNIIIYSDNFKKINQISFDEITGINRIYGKNEKNKFYLASRSYSYIYSYSLNYLYYFKYIIYLVIYFSLGLLLLGLKKIQVYQLREKNRFKDQFTSIQLRSIKNQLDPHFTFNALNVLSSIVMEGNKLAINNFILRFSKMLKIHLESSDKTSVSIKEEIEFVENFIEMQKIRFEKKIDYLKIIDPRVYENQKIPKMLIQTHVENAIKHGLIPKKEGGEIIVDISLMVNAVKIIIKDDGIGRDKAKKERRYGTGTGLKVLDDIYDLYDNLHKIKIKQNIKDLYSDDGNPIGTEVEILIPVKKQ